MSVVLIPVFSDEDHYTMTVDLDGVAYGFEFRWNARARAWFMSLRTGDGQLIASGIKLVVGWPLLHRVSDTRKPRDILAALDTSGAGQDPGRDDLGGRVHLLYGSP